MTLLMYKCKVMGSFFLFLSSLLNNHHCLLCKAMDQVFMGSVNVLFMEMMVIYSPLQSFLHECNAHLGILWTKKGPR